MTTGIIAGLITCALWGLTFVAPRAVAPFTAWDLTVARYGVFGLICALLMLKRRFRPHDIGPRRAAIGLLLGGAGYTGYFVATAFGVQHAGATVPPVIIGTMPVFLAVLANLRDRSVPWRALALPLVLTGAGIAAVNIAALDAPGIANGAALAAGIFASVAALAIWVIYGLVNAAVMRAPDAPDAMGWTGLQGIGAGLGGLLLLPLVSMNPVDMPAAPGFWPFAAWALLMGIAGSWLATWCWGIASRRLPLALSAQLIVAETVFGLLYGFLFEQRWPVAAEAAGALLQITGVCLAIMVFHGQHSQATGERARAPAA